MTKKIVFSIMFIFLLSGCASTMSMLNADSNIRKVRLGMSREQVVKIMGNSYRVISAMKTPDGDADILSWANMSSTELYVCTFLNNSLQEWHLEAWPPRNVHVHDGYRDDQHRR